LKKVFPLIAALLVFTAILMSGSLFAFVQPSGGAGAGQVGGGSEVKVKVASNFDEKAAAQLQRTLQADGYGPIELVEESPGKFAVLIGPLATQDLAKALVQDLQNSGYQAEGIVSAAETAGRTVSRAEVGKVFRVQVGEFPDEQQANGLRQTLVSDDYAGVEVVQEGGTYKVMLGAFPTERDANKLYEQLRNDGYTLAKIVQSTEAAGKSTGRAAREVEVALPSEAAARLTAEERRQAEELIRKRAQAEAGQLSADEILELREEMKKLRSEVASVVKIVTSNEQQRLERSRRIQPIAQRFNKAILDKDIAAAERALEELRAVDPNDPSIAFYATQLAQLRGVGAGGGAGDQAKKIQKLLADAKAAEEARKFEDARAYYISILGIAPDHAEARTRLSQLNELISKQQAQVAASSTSAAPKTQNLILYVGGGVIIVLLLVVGGIAVVNTRRERKLLAQVQAMAEQAGGAAAPKAPVPDTTPSPLKFTPPSTPAVSEAKPAESAPALGTSPLAQGIPSALGGGSILTDSVISKAVAVEPEEEKPAPEPSAPEIFRTEPAAANIIQESRPAGEADVLILDDLQAASGSPTPAPSAAPSAGLEEIKLPDIDIPMPSEAEAFGIGTPTGEDLATVNLDELLGETKPAEAAPAVAPTMPEAPPVEAKTPASFEVPMPNIVDITPPAKEPDTVVLQESGDSQPTIAASAEAPQEAFAPTQQLPAVEAPAATSRSEKASVGAAAAPPTASVVFEQTFDDEEVGSPPRGWQGEYEYATLVVDASNPAPNSKACLKFEKRTGAGSAHYVCHFPKVSGIVIVEFDIRCDEKNKYLLGFYIEKDEDFKQSVHTIIHRLDSRSQPTLRVQGEPVPYDLGTWRHVKYELNLLTGLVTAYVDGQEIVREAKLATNPAYVNTLSIRDNLATTGVLYLDNIRIYKG